MAEIERKDPSNPDASSPKVFSESRRQETGKEFHAERGSLKPVAARGFQFPIRELMMLTFAIAVGLAGRNWLPAKVFAGLLTIVATIVIFSVELRELSDTRINPLSIALLMACCTAIFVALLS